jgi:hypothetical protein
MNSAVGEPRECLCCRWLSLGAQNASGDFIAPYTASKAPFLSPFIHLNAPLERIKLDGNVTEGVYAYSSASLGRGTWLALGRDEKARSTSASAWVPAPVQ